MDIAKDQEGTEAIRARIGGSWRDAEDGAGGPRPVSRRASSLDRRFPPSRICDDALAAAHKAKDVMAAMPGYERAALLHRAADILATRTDDIGRAMALESGKALRDSLLETRAFGRHSSPVRRGSRAHPGRARPHGRERPRRRQDRDAHALSGRRGRGHHAVQRTRQSGLPQAGTGTRRGQQHRPQAFAEGAALRAQARRSVHRRRRPAGRGQYRLWRCHRTAARDRSPRRLRELHRLDPRREDHPQLGRHETRRPRARWRRTDFRASRCGPCRRRRSSAHAIPWRSQVRVAFPSRTSSCTSASTTPLSTRWRARWMPSALATRWTWRPRSAR